ncbi:MAG: Sensor histidine kinase [candidate division TM6 bacterium GW2011_GWF2_30_66]|nr:MAG: Sensor histidine kinase [candidate division TM6 bacterium GW2011_GWF2_30_66]
MVTNNFKNYLWVIPFLSFLLGYFTVQKIFQPKSFNTPAIVGKKLQEAISILSKNQLNIKFIMEKEDSNLPHGTILSQKPIPGLKITPNQSVYVTISKKPDRLMCPELFNKKMDNIAQILKSKNLKNKSYYIPSNLPENSCVAQYPLPDFSVKDTCIITYVSKGHKKPVIFPNFKNKNLNSVLDFLKNHNIKSEIIYSDDPVSSKRKLKKIKTNQEISKQETNPTDQEAQNSQIMQTQTNLEQETKASPETQDQSMQTLESQMQNGQDMQTSQTQNVQTEPEINQENINTTEIQETPDLTILDQRPLAGSLVNLNPDKPITVHLKVFRNKSF